MMLSLQLLPFEVLQGVAGHLEKKEKLICIITCRALYQPCLESLYQHVVITTLVSFRCFLLSITHHRHQPNFYVKRLDLIIDLWLTYGKEERPMTFTEFELLARYCPNLTQLFFYEYEYWRFLSTLDLEKFWPRLGKLPAMNNYNKSIHVYKSMANRLVEMNISGPFQSPINVENLLSNMHNLESIRIDDREITIDTNFIQQINSKYPCLQSLDLSTKIAANTNIIDSNSVHTTLKNLHCDIDHPTSAWFSLFKKSYKDIRNLSIRYIGRNGDPDHLLKMIAPSLEIIQDTNIQRVTSNFIHVKEYATFVENFILETVYGYDIWDKSGTPSSFAVNIEYSDRSESIDGLTSQFTRRKDTPQHEFTLKCAVNKKYDFDAMKFLSHIIQKPIHLQLTRLTFTRTVRLIATGANNFLGDRTDAAHQLYLDSALDYFPNLESLTFILVKKKIDNPFRSRPKKWRSPAEYDDDYDFSVVTLFDKKSPSRLYPHHSLRKLTIKSSRIDRSVYIYLFRKCPNLSTLCIQDCKLKDDETLLALEYFCLEHNVDLLFLNSSNSGSNFISFS